jgi:hypothetical protein
LAAQVVVGVIGSDFHVGTDVNAPAAKLGERFLHGATLFAPFLFADLSLLAARAL